VSPPDAYVVDTNGQWFEIENSGGGGVRVELVAPTGAVINVVGGSGYEFMVAHDASQRSTV